MKKNIDISIVVPIYNAEKYLKRCIDSIINQTKKELEIILINDGSTDNSKKIIKEYKDKRIKYFKNENQGIGKTRNFGIEKATGKYLMFLDSDDFLDKNICKYLYNKCEKDNLDIAICDFYRYLDKDNKEILKQPEFKNSSLKDNPEIISENLAPWAKLYRTDIIKENDIKFVRNLKYEDAPFVIKALDKASLIGKVNKPLYYYVIHNNSETTVRDERVFDIIKIIDIIRKYTQDKEYLKDKIDRLTVRILTNYTIQQRNQKDKKIANKFINQAFKYLKREVPDYQDDKYYEGRGFLRSSIEKSKLLTKIYVFLYKKIK